MRIPEKLKNLIKKKKSLSLSEYIEFCLYDVDNGYYQKRKVINQDFTTAPEISQIFGECIAIFFLNFFDAFKESGLTKTFFELGPGKGTLANDILRVIKKKINTININLIERSNKLINEQKTLIEKKISNVNINWSNNLDLKKNHGPIFFYCNEFFDSLPISQFFYSRNVLFEKRVSINKENKICFVNVRSNEKIPSYFSEMKNNSIFEYSFQTKFFLDQIFKYITNNGGVLLLFDYGPILKKGYDSIQCIHKNKKCSIFDFPCHSDITHHVDFQYMKNLAQNYSLNCHGPITQSEFLIKFGGYERLDILQRLNKTEKNHSLKINFLRLIKPSEMGSLFKCILFTGKNYDISKSIF